MRQNILYSIPADGGGTPQPLTSDSLSGSDPNWSLDGRFLVYVNQGNLWYLDFQGDQKPALILQSRTYSGNPVISPDSRYLAYTSYETGNPEVYVTRFPSGEGKWPVSVDGGSAPKWSPLGDELFYVEEDRLMTVSVETESRFRAGQPDPVFEVRPVQVPRLRFTGYDVSADGQRFVVVQNVGESRPMLTIVENWAREFNKP
jgi:Tol biopolymer transport system component